MSYGVIYIVKNKVNEKVYIGQTIHGFDKRYPKGIICTHNDHLKSAIKTYGIDNFEINKEVYIAETKEQLDCEEIRLIKSYKADNKKHGYNYLSGGHNGKHNEESRRKIGDAQKGELNHMYGKYGKENPKYSRVSKNCSCCGKQIEVLPADMKRSKKHYCSVECAKKDKKNCLPKKKTSKIKVVCSNCNCEFLKFPSQIKNREHLYCSVECKNEYQKTLLKGGGNPNFGNNKVRGENNGRAKKVICLTTGELFGCARDAERKYNISRGLICACCRGEQKTCNSMEWTYE